MIPVPTGTRAQRLATLAAFKNRRDDLGTTHHDAGTMRMGDDVADAVTNDFGRIHDTTNCYVAGPACSQPWVRRTHAHRRRTWRAGPAILLNASVLPGPDPVVSPQSGGWLPTALRSAPLPRSKTGGSAGPAGGGMLHPNGEMVSYGEGGLRLFFYATESSPTSRYGCSSNLRCRLAQQSASSCASRVRPRSDAALKLRTAHESAFDAAIRPGGR